MMWYEPRVAADPAVAAEMFGNRLRKRARHLRKWARREGVTCFRVYDRDIPEIPLAVDIYEDHLHVSEFADCDPAWTDAMVAVAQDALGVTGTAHVKRRERQKGLQQYERVDDAGERVIVREGGYRFYVNLGDYLDTGLFLDHRLLRARVGAESAGKRVLNLFCYTGAFTVYAAGGGASSTVSVDLSNTYLRWARDNLQLNGLDGELRRADALALLDDPPRDLEPFDLVVLDPPTFSNSKKMRDVLDVQRDHPRLINGALRLLRPGGALYFSTNHRRFRLEPARLATPRVEDITAATTPPDFPRAHRAWRLVR